MIQLQSVTLSEKVIPLKFTKPKETFKSILLKFTKTRVTVKSNPTPGENGRREQRLRGRLTEFEYSRAAPRCARIVGSGPRVPPSPSPDRFRVSPCYTRNAKMADRSVRSTSLPRCSLPRRACFPCQNK